MLTGFNTDIKHGDRVFHVQTEDRGLGNPVVESLVYVGGEILLSKKSAYVEHVDGARVDEKAVKAMMDLQHRRIIEAIRRGRFDGAKPGGPPPDLGAAVPPPAPRPPAPPPLSPAAAAATAALLGGGGDRMAAGAKTSPVPPPRPAPVPPRPVSGSPSPERSLDQVIIEYLASEAAAERIELTMMKGGELVSGANVPLSIRVATALTDRPVAGAQITIRVVLSSGASSVLHRGVSGNDGLVKVTIPLPAIGTTNAALIISATCPQGSAEVKHLLKRQP